LIRALVYNYITDCILWGITHVLPHTIIKARNQNKSVPQKLNNKYNHK